MPHRGSSGFPPTVPNGKYFRPMATAPNSLQIREAGSPADLALIRELFLEYARSIEVDLCFQNFNQELATLPGRYAAPTGCLLLAFRENEPAGCVAVRGLEGGICEMKRLYVRPGFRRHGGGRLLAEGVIAAARRAGYTAMRLDTLSSMEAAIALYRSLGFRPIAPYYDNPSGLAVFMELDLRR
jgi:ribosomal protein S18 acetylase RimI-like enzyme